MVVVGNDSCRVIQKEKREHVKIRPKGGILIQGAEPIARNRYFEGTLHVVFDV